MARLHLSYNLQILHNLNPGLTRLAQTSQQSQFHAWDHSLYIKTDDMTAPPKKIAIGQILASSVLVDGTWTKLKTQFVIWA